MRTTLAIALVSALLLPAAAQTTWYVDSAALSPGDGSAANPYPSIQHAHDQASTVTGDTLAVAAGTYVENLLITKRVKIVAGGGPDATRLVAAAPGNLIKSLASDNAPLATLRGFTLDGSAFPSGTGVSVGSPGSGTLRMERCVIRDFSSGLAVRIASSASFLDAFQCTLAFNGTGVHVSPSMSHGQASLIGCISRFNTVELTGTEAGYYAVYSNVDPSVLAMSNQCTSADPSLWNAPARDFHLRAGSPCIDVAPPPVLPLDPDGSWADVGAYAFDPSYGWTSYCTSGVTSSGCAPTISASGAPSAAASSGFTLTVAGVEGQKDGHLFYGLSGPHAAPWGGSSHFLCVKAPSQRTGTQNSGGTAGACDGAIALDWCAYVATHPSALGAPFSAGTSVWAQLYFRDPPGPKTTALSNALTFTVIP